MKASILSATLRCLLLFLASFAVAPSVLGRTLVEVTGAVNGGKQVTTGQAAAVAFVLNQGASNVKISVGTAAAPLLCINCQGTLFLSKMLGAQATVGDIVSTKALAPSTTNQFMDGLTLPAGTYYFVIAISQGSLAWPGTIGATITNDPAAADSLDLFASSTGISPLTANYAVTSGIGALHYTLTGDIASFAITRIASVRDNGNLIGHEVTFNSEPGVTYILEYSETMSEWFTDPQQLPSFPSQGNVTTTFVGALPIPKEYYRIRKL